MTHWTEDALQLAFMEGVTNWEAVKPDYLRVFVALGGPDERLNWRMPIDDSPFTAKVCCRFPLSSWGWHFGDTDDDLRWWPHLARIAAIHSVADRLAPPWLPLHEEMSLTEFADTLGAIGDHLQRAAALLLSLEGCAHRTRAPVPTEQARADLYMETTYKLGESWVDKGGEYPRFGYSRAREKLSAFSYQCWLYADEINALNPDDYKIGAQRFDGLIQLVFNAGAYWGARFGRPSAERVARRDGTTDPPFVRFVQGLCALVGQPQPTRGQVRTGILRAVEQGVW